MAFNGSGVFVRLYNWVNDRNAGILIRADRMDAEMNGMATALTDCVTRDGQSPALANLPMATFIHTNVGNGTARNHYAALGQLQDGTINWVAAAGTADAITASYSPILTALIDGQLCYFRASAANATATPTFSPNGLTAHTITKSGGSALAVGDIPAANAEITLRYNLANTRWELLSGGSGNSSFLDSTFRIADDGDNTKKIAFQASGITTGTTRTLTVPDADLTVVGVDTAQTLTHKTYDTAATGNSFLINGVAATANTGTGAVARAAAPTFTTPTLGAALATSINFGGNSLSSYVEAGSFTPTIAGTGTPGTGTYSNQQGSYTRIGNVVFFYVRVSWSAHTGAGNMVMNGLPITAVLTTPFNIVTDSMTSPANTIVKCMVNTSTTQVVFYSEGVATGSFASLALDTASDVFMSGSYFV